MALGSPNLGTLGAKAFFSIPYLPAIVAEWFALIPLVCHLAAYAEDHELIGKISLTCNLSVGLFPKLGSLDAIARLLRGKVEFLDQASTKGNMYNVWDVICGGSFPCANCSASRIIAAYATRNGPLTKIPESVKQTDHPNETIKVRECGHDRLKADLQRKSSTGYFRRPQTLHVMRFRREVNQQSIRKKIFDLMALPSFQAVLRLMELGLVVTLILFGAYGTAAVLLSSLLCRFACWFATIGRPSGYLENNETHNASMLVGLHKNTTIWYLYVGDRGVVDWLLNKTMISIKSPHAALSKFLWVAHHFQLLAMTYVAAQKGWDGVCLLALLFVDGIIRSALGQNELAQMWLDMNGVSVDAQSFEFSGRTSMVGAIQIISAAPKASWMDDIITPSARREVWNNRLNAFQKRVTAEESEKDLSSSDHAWVELNTRLSIQAASIIQSMRKRNNSCE